MMAEKRKLFPPFPLTASMNSLLLSVISDTALNKTVEVAPSKVRKVNQAGKPRQGGNAIFTTFCDTF